MFWLSISNVAPELEPIAADSRPWAILKKIWRFCDLYGEYKAKPPTQRRKFILELEQRCGETHSRI
jgi:hypothetical protein